MKNKVREYRIKREMTQQELADLVHVTARTIISLEKEQYNPSVMLAYRISGVFGTTIEELCCLRENMEKEEMEYEQMRKDIAGKTY